MSVCSLCFTSLDRILYDQNTTVIITELKKLIPGSGGFVQQIVKYLFNQHLFYLLGLGAVDQLVDQHLHRGGSYGGNRLLWKQHFNKSVITIVYEVFQAQSEQVSQDEGIIRNMAPQRTKF